MSSPAPAVRPRPSGGFNAGMGNFNDSFENLDENAMQAAAKQKTLAQQATSSTQSTTGGSALGTQPAGGLGGLMGQGAGAQPAKPRPMASIPEELIQRPAQDIVKGLTSLFDINSILGIHLEKDDPQTQAKKKQMLQRWNQLNDEDKEYASKKYQEETQKKQKEEQEKEAQKQQAEEAKKQELVVPSSPKNGPVGPGGSKKQKAVSKLQQDRKGLGNAKGSN
jgi:hypothetical protein